MSTGIGNQMGVEAPSDDPRPKGADANLEAKSRAVTDGEMILATVDIASTAERVYRALTTKEAEIWWGSADTYRIRDWQTDLRVGGAWSLSIHLPNGMVFPASGKFLEIEAPGKVVQTRRYDWDHPTLGRRDTTVTYRLDPVATGTRVTVRHDGFAGCGEAAVEHEAGWVRFLDWLQAYLQTDENTNHPPIFEGDRT